MAEYEYHYSRYPSLKAYIDRIGAEQLNFRRFEVREYRGKGRTGYYRIRARIKIVNSCEIECNAKGLEPEEAERLSPTEEEASAIEAELKDVKWPYSILAGISQADDFINSGGRITGLAYKFLDLSRKSVVMIQERRDQDDGGKIYIPWTMFQGGSGDTWRQMEPDGPLPFWKPPKKRQKPHVMIHEGAKKAAFVDGLINDPERREEREAHPWAEELAGYEHWGASGGALAIDRGDYRELHSAGFEGDVVYVCDCDALGVEAVRTFSREFKKPMLAVIFGENFPPGWDLANKIPDSLLNGYGRVDIRLSDLLRPATFATKVTDVRRGHLVYGLTDQFAQEWAHTITPEVFINRRWPRIMLSREKFNNYVAPFTHHPRIEVSDLLQQYLNCKAEKIEYRPDLEPGFYPSPDGSFFNVYQPRHFEPYGPKEKPDLSLFEEYLEKVFPVERQRLEVKRWIATLIARPAVKMRYGLLLVSETQGVGKTTLGHILTEVIGRHNACSPAEEEIVESNWTYWKGEHRLVTIEEIYQGHSVKAYNKLKGVITDDKVRVMKKFLEPYWTKNYVHVIACSNSRYALRLDNTDRRWYVPEVTEEKQTEEYWVKLYRWLEKEEGYRKIKHWAKKFLAENEEYEVKTGSAAPGSKAKQDMIRDSYSAGMDLIDKTLAWIAQAYLVKGEDLLPTGAETQRVIEMAKSGQHFIMVDRDGQRAIKTYIHHGQDSDKLESPLTIRKVVQAAGFYVGKERIKTWDWKSAYNGRVISLSAELSAKPVAELLTEQVPRIDLAKLAGELEGL